MNFKKKKGITLIEIVIAMAVMAIVLATVAVAFNANSNILSKVDMKSELQLDAQMIQEQLSKVALESSGINSLSSENDLILNDSMNDKVTHHFKLMGSQLSYQVIEVKEVDGESIEEVKRQTLLSKYVKSFTFTSETKGLKYQIELSMTHGKNTESLMVENQIFFRNSR